MNKYTFRLGNKKECGLELLFAVVADDLIDGIRLGREQLYEQMDENNRLNLDLKWGLMGTLATDLAMISEASLVNIEPVLEASPATQIPMDLRPAMEMSELFQSSYGLGLIPLDPQPQAA